ncbi:MAG TPA: hypothetical protein VEU96_31930 [Bryobacteraceae bacterium]|nr:hypothetical protein [Bryobacteraceae bacterium]
MRLAVPVFVCFATSLIHADVTSTSCVAESSLAPASSGRESTIAFTNRTGAPVNIYLRNEARQRLFLRALAPGEKFSQSAAEGQPFVITDAAGRCLEVHRAAAVESHAEITATEPAATASGPIIQTYAGTDWTFQADGQLASNAPLGATTGLASDSAGNLYITDNLNYQVYRVDTTGVLRVIGGNGFDSDRVTGVDARKAPFNRPISVAVGPDGSIYVGQSYTIVKIGLDGIVRKFAGLSQAVFSGDGGPAIKAGVQTPTAMVFDSAGNLFYSDHGSRVRKIDTNGIITTFAGNGQQAFAGDNGQATSASLLDAAGLRFDAAGNLYVAETGSGRIRKVDKSGIITTFAGGGAAFKDGVPATQTSLAGPIALDFDAAGNLYILEQAGRRVRKVAPDGTITTVAGGGGPAGFSGDGGPAANAQFNAPIALKVDASGNVYVGDSNNRRVRRFTPGGNITTVAGNGLYRSSPDGARATLSFLKDPIRVAIGPDGRVYIADFGDARIRRVEADGTLTTVVGTGQSIFTPGKGPFPAASTSITAVDGLTFDPQGNLYFVESGLIRRVTRDGMMTTYGGGGGQNPGNEGPATNAVLSGPSALTSDRSGTLYFTEPPVGGIRKITPDGMIHAVAGAGSPGFADGPAAQAQFTAPRGLTLDSTGNLYIADLGNNRVRKQDTNGNVSTYAGTGQTSPLGNGGPANLATLSAPADLAFDLAGNLLIVDQFHQQIRSVSPGGTISTLAGNGAILFAGDGGPAQAASLNNPYGIAVDNGGNVYLADRNNFRVRIIPTALPTFTASPTSLNFTVRSGDAPPKPQQVSLASSVAGLPYTVTITGSFLTVNASSVVTPANVDVTVNPANLAPGTYPGTITFTPGVTGVPPASVAVSVVVQPPIPSLLAVDTSGLAFSLVRGGSAASKRVLVLDSGNGSVDFTVSTKTSSGGSWLSASPAAGTATNSAPVSLLVTADPNGLAAGTYSGNVIVADDDGGTTILVPVTMTLSGSGQIIRLSQSGLTFVGVVGGGVSPAQSVVVLNAGQGAFQFNAVARPTSGSWLAATPSSGTSDSSKAFPAITIGVDASGLSAGDYFGRIEVNSPTADNSPQYITVVLHLLPAGSDPGPFVQPSGLVFTGVSGGGDPASQTVLVANLSATPVSFGSGVATLDGGKYITYQPAFSSLPTGSLQLVVQPTFAGLAPGIYRGAITLVFSDGGIQTVAILIVIAPAGTVLGSSNGMATTPAAGCTPTKLLPLITSLGSNFSVPASFPTALETRVVDDCGSPVTSGSVVSSFSSGDAPLAMVSLGDGNWSATWLSRHVDQRQVSITGTADMPQPQLHGSVQVTGGLSGNAAPPVIGSGGIVSASSFAAQTPLAPGAMVSIFGAKLGNGTAAAPSLPLGTQLAGATLVVAGQSMPLLYASDGQVNALLPFGVPVNTRVQVIATNGSQVSLPEEISIAAAEPGVFQVNAAVNNQGHIYVAHADGTASLAASASPAAAGDEVVIYCSGLGAVNVPVVDGAASPFSPIAFAVNTPAVTIGGVNARVDFAGLTPGFAGLYQINAAVPGGVTPGNQVPLVITSVGQSSAVVTMAVR